MFWRMQHHPGIVEIKRRLKEGFINRFQEQFWIDALRRCKDEGLAYRLHHRADHKISGKLECIGLPWFSADDREPAPDRIEHGSNLLKGGHVSGGNAPA